MSESSYKPIPTPNPAALTLKFEIYEHVGTILQTNEVNALVGWLGNEDRMPSNVEQVEDNYDPGTYGQVQK